MSSRRWLPSKPNPEAISPTPFRRSDEGPACHNEITDADATVRLPDALTRHKKCSAIVIRNLTERTQIALYFQQRLSPGAHVFSQEPNWRKAKRPYRIPFIAGDEKFCSTKRTQEVLCSQQNARVRKLRVTHYSQPHGRRLQASGKSLPARGLI
jgi:hypothetical protein